MCVCVDGNICIVKIAVICFYVLSVVLFCSSCFLFLLCDWMIVAVHSVFCSLL